MVTIIIPCYNYARFLPAAIESAMSQRGVHGPIEVLIVDDGSTDDTALIAAQYQEHVRYLHKANAGLSAARNTGMEQAAYSLVFFLDADDMIAPNALSRLLESWHQIAPSPAILAGRDLPVDADGKPLSSIADSGSVSRVPARSLVLRNRFAPGVLADRHVLLGLGGFDPSLRASEDRDMWIRAATRHPVFMLDRVVLLKRDHGANMSRAARQQTAAIEQVLAKAFANPELQLNSNDRRLARAVCLYQSALMYSDAGEYHAAALQMLRSLLGCPLGALKDAGIPPFSRLRGLLGNWVKSLHSILAFAQDRL